jgi:non-ribosomal peptide synthase protein (TIGR01720 family)
VISLWSVGASSDDAGSSDARISRGYYGLLFLTQALGERGATDNLRMTVVTSDAQEVTGSESLCPSNATAIALARTIPIEYPGASCQAVDVTIGDAATRIAHAIVGEALSSGADQIVAWRGRFRWIQTHEPAGLPLDPNGRLLHGGVYLITGGLGGVGLEIASYLAHRCAARLVLVGRRAVPPREQWADIARGGGQDLRAQRTARALLDIEAACGGLLICEGDVADRDRMISIVAEATARFGPVNGVIHAAGVPGGGVLQRQTRQAAERVFAAKIRGTRILESIFADAPLDFAVLCSSLVSFMPLAGRAEYMAANLFVDAAARRWAARSPYHVAAINWDSWREVGMAVETARARCGADEEVSIEGMRSADGVEAFARALSGNIPQVIVAMAGLGPSDRPSAPLSLPATVDGTDARPSTAHARPALKTAYVAPRNDAERTLAGIWTELLGIDPVGVEDNFFDLGGDSVVSIQIISRANRAGIRLTPKQVFEYQTIAELAAVAASDPATSGAAALRGSVTAAPLTAIQRWFFEQEFPTPGHFNQAVLLEVRRPVSESMLRDTLEAVASHHDALRFRFQHADGSWCQSLDRSSTTVPLEWIDLSALGRDEQARAITERSAALQTRLDLASGPIARAAYFDLGSAIPGRLLIIVHHLVIDAVSWRFLIEDVATALDQSARHQPIALAPRTESFAHWAARMDDIAQSAEIEAELPYWLDLAESRPTPLPVDFDRGPNDMRSARTVTIGLTPEETRALLTEASSAYHTQANDLLLAAFGATLARWSGDRSLFLTFEGHGRNAILEDLDVSRTIGWFTTMYPLRLELEGLSDWAAVIPSVKEQVRAVPRDGMGYGLLRHLNRKPEIGDGVRRMPRPDALWLYLGQFDAGAGPAAPVSVAGERVGAERDPSGARTHLIEVTSMIVGGRLQTTFTYSVNRHRRETIDGLAARYKESVLAAIAHCRSVEAATFTPSDFPQAGLSQTELDALFARLAES